MNAFGLNLHTAAVIIIPMLIISLSSSACAKCGENRFLPAEAAFAGILLHRILGSASLPDGIAAFSVTALSALLAGALIALAYIFIRRRAGAQKPLFVISATLFLSVILLGFTEESSKTALDNNTVLIIASALFIAISATLIFVRKLRLSMKAAGESCRSASDMGIKTERMTVAVAIIACAVSGAVGALACGAGAITAEKLMLMILIISAVSRERLVLSALLALCASFACAYIRIIEGADGNLAFTILTAVSAILMPRERKR
ncbi:MAG: hypothetical protein PHI27_12665 [Eubacteriales bacterium]|nr:hypothetical protein [Eubacteriales bacterium]MDD3883075.1 hypothetical protein [Eubacteriales bacterium]MDD4512600.1 hypothetical protein [Eubacteriales bacterium]